MEKLSDRMNMLSKQNSTQCQHESYTEGDVGGFVGPVSSGDENPAAHGCVTYLETCSRCGAQRKVNQNQWHYEYGSWSKSRHARLADAIAEQKRAEHAAARHFPVTLCCGEERVTVSLDREGYLILSAHSLSDEDAILSALPVEAVQAACRLRHAVMDRQVQEG